MLGGYFGSMVSEGQFNRFFVTVGLPWVRGSYYRTRVDLQTSAVGAYLSNRLPSEYSQKGLFCAKGREIGGLVRFERQSQRGRGGLYESRERQAGLYW